MLTPGLLKQSGGGQWGCDTAQPNTMFAALQLYIKSMPPLKHYLGIVWLSQHVASCTSLFKVIFIVDQRKCPENQLEKFGRR